MSPAGLQQWNDWYVKHGPWSREKNQEYVSASFARRQAMWRELPKRTPAQQDADRARLGRAIQRHLEAQMQQQGKA
jgi:hypothetical protein